MAKVKMSVAEALATRKNLKKKIEKKIQSFDSIAVRCNSNDTMIMDKTVKEWESKAKATYQSLQTLTLNYDILNSAIIKSNATTEVTLYGRKMSVAEAIALKQSPMNDVMKTLLVKLESDYSKAVKKKETLAAKSLGEENISKAVAFIKCTSKESEDAIRKKVIDLNTPIIVDPLKEEREKRNKAYEEYENKIDAILQKSNCDTIITVEYVD